MGIALCKRHGESGIFPSVSFDLVEDCYKGSRNTIDIYVVVVKVFDEDEYLFEQESYISGDIFNSLSMKYEYIIRNDCDEEHLSAFFPKTTGFCMYCFKEYVEKNGIKIHRKK